MVLPDRITHWIENLPDPSEASLRRSGRKRCWDEMNDNQTPERRRRILTPNTSTGHPDNNYRDHASASTLRIQHSCLCARPATQSLRILSFFNPLIRNSIGNRIQPEPGSQTSEE
jgi:hypothetical protein